MSDKSIMTWNELQSEFDVMRHLSCVPSDIHRVPLNHVFDENKSVKWNKEEATRHNELYQAEVARLNTEKNKRRDAVVSHIVEKIQDEVGHNLSAKKAKAIWDYAYDTSHSYGFEVIYATLAELIELADVLLSKTK